MPTPWGMCGVAPNTHISLWVGQRKVLSRHWVQRSCFGDRAYGDIIILDGDTLTLCASAETVARLEGVKPDPGCRDASDRLRQALHDPVEYPEDPGARPKVGTITIKLTEYPYLRTAFLRPLSSHDSLVAAHSNWLRHRAAMMEPPAPGTQDNPADLVGTRFTFPYDDAKPIEFQPVIQLPDDPKDVRMIDPSYARVDFDNDRTVGMVFREKTLSRAGVNEDFHIYSDAIALGAPDKLEAFIDDER